jgi:CheY-like chemotaxis protein
VLVDMARPDSNGLELIRAIKSDPDHASAQILMLTLPGQTVPEASKYAARQLDKPVQLVELIGLANERGDPGEACPADASSVQDPLATDATTADLLPAGDVPAGADPTRVRSAKQRALVVEDNAINLMVAAGILENLGWKVETAVNGLDALEAYERRHFDVIFMDCQMPKMDGFEATSEIRKREAAGAARTPIVALTASADRSYRERCLNAGMDHFVAKPFTRRQIAAALAAVA